MDVDHTSDGGATILLVILVFVINYRTAAKLAVGLGAVAVTVDQGVWSTSTDGSKALWKVRTKVLPTTNEYVQKVNITVCKA